MHLSLTNGKSSINNTIPTPWVGNRNMNWMDYNRIGLTRSESGDYKGAVDDYTQALNLNPEVWCLYYNRASARCRLGDYQGAIDDYTQALNLNPGDEISYIRRGYARLQLGDYQGAIDDNAHAQLRRN